MKKSVQKRGMALLLSCALAFGTCLGLSGASFSIFAYTEKSATVIASSLNVRSGAGTGHSAVARLSNGTSVTVIGEEKALDGTLWYQIRFTGSGGAQTTGYVSSHYLKLASQNLATDRDFESYMDQQGFPESYKQGLRELHSKYPKWKFTAFQTGLDWETAVAEESKVTRNLVARSSISSWKSTEAGAYDWSTGSWPGFDGSSWVAASSDIISYYMDPRNFLNETYIYQFMNQSYDASLHTQEGLSGMVDGTFLSGTAASGGAEGSRGGSSSGSGSPGSGSSDPGSSDSSGSSSGGTDDNYEIAPGQIGGPGAAVQIPLKSAEEDGSLSLEALRTDRVSTYGPGMDSDGSSPGSGEENPGGDSSQPSGSRSYTGIIMDAAAQSGVNPYILASMILVEQGKQGTGRSISGTVSGYQGYYNFFNIEAYQSGSMGAVERGLWWASQSGSYGRPWNSREGSIIGGAKWYAENYVNRGQNTLYLKKFNVQGSSPYTHQYMTNVQAAATEGAELAKISSLKDSALSFSIPVYKNMPESACAQPTLDGSPNNKLAGLGADGFALTPTFNKDTESYDLIVDPSVETVKVEASAIDSKAAVSGTGTISLQSGINDITVSVRAENGHVRNYVIHVVRQNNGPTYSDSIDSGVTPGGTSGPGSPSGPGGSDTSVEIIGPVIAPDGSTGGQDSSSGSSDGPVAPDGGVGGFGTGENGSGIQKPGSSGSGSGKDSGYYQASIGTSAAKLAAQMEGEGAGALVKVYTASGGEVTGTVATGNLIQAYDSGGDGKARYTVVVRGDCSGDGKLNVLDILGAQRHLLGLGSLSGPYEKAADVNGNQKIDITDILAMQRDVLGIEKLN